MCRSCAAQESLRKYSVVPVVVRQLSAEDEIEGHSIPAGTTIICHLQVRGSWPQRPTLHICLHLPVVTQVRISRLSSGSSAFITNEVFQHYSMSHFIIDCRRCTTHGRHQTRGDRSASCRVASTTASTRTSAPTW